MGESEDMWSYSKYVDVLHQAPHPWPQWRAEPCILAGLGNDQARSHSSPKRAPVPLLQPHREGVHPSYLPLKPEASLQDGAMELAKGIAMSDSLTCVDMLGNPLTSEVTLEPEFAWWMPGERCLPTVLYFN